VLLMVLVTNSKASEIKVGEFQNTKHGVGGSVYKIDDHTLLVKGFTYDGKGPDAFFWAGKEGVPSSNGGTILPYPFENKFYDYDDKNATIIEGRFDGNKDIRLTTPQSLKTTDIKWLSVWCRKFEVNFGSFNFKIPGEEEDSTPKPEPETEPEDSNGAGSNQVSLMIKMMKLVFVWVVVKQLIV